MPVLDDPRTALVLLRADRPRSLWDDASSPLVDDVEARLEGVFVTSATLAGRGASLGDALAAARFMGADSAVLVVVEDRPGGRAAEALARSASRALPVTPIRCAADPAEIVAAYRLAAAGPAATA